MEQTHRPFNLREFLESSGTGRAIVKYRRGETIFTQGADSKGVMYIQEGAVKLSRLTKTGREGVVAMLGHDEFFGEGCLAGEAFRTATATAVTSSAILIVEKNEMLRMLRQEPTLTDRFISHMVTRNIRFEADLLDQLLNSTEKRLARKLLLLARLDKEEPGEPVLSSLSQATLAEMVGTTRSHVNLLMNKFKRSGFIESNGGLKIHPSLVNVVLHE